MLSMPCHACMHHATKAVDNVLWGAAHDSRVRYAGHGSCRHAGPRPQSTAAAAAAAGRPTATMGRAEAWGLWGEGRRG
jgi:hypothetical protein